MIDQVDHDETGADETRAAEEAAAVIHTGNAVVDDVLASLEALPGLPLEQHVALFERAHEQLRGALDGPREP